MKPTVTKRKTQVVGFKPLNQLTPQQRFDLAVKGTCDLTRIQCVEIIQFRCYGLVVIKKTQMPCDGIVELDPIAINPDADMVYAHIVGATSVGLIIQLYDGNCHMLPFEEFSLTLLRQVCCSIICTFISEEN